MKSCAQCNATFEEGGRFCPECGAVAEELSPRIALQENFVGRVERNIYFRIVRGYAWLIVLLSIGGLVISILALGPAAMDLWFGGDIKVTSDDIRRTMASQQRGGRAVEETERTDPASPLGRLNRAIDEIIDLLPRDQQQRDMFGRVALVKLEVEQLRRLIKERVNHLHDHSDQIAALTEVKDVIIVFPQADRLVALDKFFEIKVAKQNAVQAKKAEAAAKLTAGSVAILSSISIITLGSMVLVLLAVERNTRTT
jgi:hypothetical protein